MELVKAACAIHQLVEHHDFPSSADDLKDLVDGTTYGLLVHTLHGILPGTFKQFFAFLPLSFYARIMPPPVRTASDWKARGTPSSNSENERKCHEQHRQDHD